MKTNKLIKEGFTKSEAEVIESYSEFGESKTQIISYELSKTAKRIIFLIGIVIGLFVYKTL